MEEWKENPEKRRGLKLTPVRVKKALEGSHGIKGLIAQRLGCSYYALSKAMAREGDAWDECRYLYKLEQEKVGDLAERTVFEVMRSMKDVPVAAQTARWYLDRKHVDRGYGKKEQVTLEGGQNPISVNHTLIPISALNLPLETKRDILKAMEAWEKENKQNESGS
jgi:hypothetical protein